MRARLFFIVLALLVLVGFAALNWPEFRRPTPLSFGVFSVTWPLGVLMFAFAGLVLAVFFVSSAIQESRYLLEHRRHTRALQEQRDLAEKAEASRFTDLRQHFDTQLRESRQRDAIASPEFERTLMQGQRELKTQIEQLQHLVAGRLTDLEARLPAKELPPGTEPGSAADPTARGRLRV
ncbi:hypothetical protein GCM10027034_04870 [Ramlibacter solisilvae]|uniref:LapA family protein n=1 Tax=Ramlibacter tataouinensis TaxID=94132 RepID=UPI0007772776|nr:LapA family protein [Ramlibacter tataouinensis]